MWFANGMSEHDVMVLAGHTSYANHKFYIALANDLIHRARVGPTSKIGTFSYAALWKLKRWLTHVWEIVILPQLRFYRECSSVGRATAF